MRSSYNLRKPFSENINPDRDLIAMSYDPQKYGALLADLLNLKEPPSLGPGKPSMFNRIRVVGATLESLFMGITIKDFAMARCCHAGVMLMHDFLEESHQLSQHVENSSGFYWHALMHRREPDPGNAKYWFKEVGDHPIYEPLQQISLRLSAASPKCPLASAPIWDPVLFVDFCEAHRDKGTSEEMLARRLQIAEMRLLFDFCFSQATQASPANRSGHPKSVR